MMLFKLDKQNQSKDLATALQPWFALRRGTTLMETLVATALLTTAMIGVGRFRASTTM